MTEQNAPLEQSSDFAMIDMGENEELGMMEDLQYTKPSINESSEKADSRYTDWSFSSSSFEDNVKLATSVTSMVQKGRQAWSFYANIDILRPYFDVEPYTVIRRLAESLLPTRPTTTRQRVARELYGPLMVVLTLIALLLFQMKSSEHRVEEGTLMGTAFAVCFSYWVGFSSIVWFLSFVTNCTVSYVQLLSLIGYGQFGHCIVILITTAIHTSHDHVFFYVVWGIVGGLSSLRLVTILASRTVGNTQRVIICALVAAVHLLYLLYLHFAYHQIVEEISDVIRGPQRPHFIVDELDQPKLPILSMKPSVIVAGSINSMGKGHIRSSVGVA